MLTTVHKAFGGGLPIYGTLIVNGSPAGMVKSLIAKLVSSFGGPEIEQKVTKTSNLKF